MIEQCEMVEMECQQVKRQQAHVELAKIGLHGHSTKQVNYRRIFALVEKRCKHRSDKRCEIEELNEYSKNHD
jgi:hypothetical protein